MTWQWRRQGRIPLVNIVAGKNSSNRGTFCKKDSVAAPRIKRDTFQKDHLQKDFLAEGLLYLADRLIHLTEGLLYLTEGLLYLTEGLLCLEKELLCLAEGLSYRRTLQKEGQKTVTPSRCCCWVLRLLATLRFSSPSEPESSEGRFDAFSTLRSLFIVRSVVKRSPCMELSGTACGRNLLPFTAWSCSEHHAHYWGWVRMSPCRHNRTTAIL